MQTPATGRKWEKRMRRLSGFKRATRLPKGKGENPDAKNGRNKSPSVEGPLHT